MGKMLHYGRKERMSTFNDSGWREPLELEKREARYEKFKRARDKKRRVKPTQKQEREFWRRLREREEEIQRHMDSMKDKG